MRGKLRPYRLTLIFAGTAMIGATLMEILRPWPIKIIFDGLLVPAENKDLITQSAID